MLENTNLVSKVRFYSLEVLHSHLSDRYRCWTAFLTETVYGRVADIYLLYVLGWDGYRLPYLNYAKSSKMYKNLFSKTYPSALRCDSREQRHDPCVWLCYLWPEPDSHTQWSLCRAQSSSLRDKGLHHHPQGVRIHNCKTVVVDCSGFMLVIWTLNRPARHRCIIKCNVRVASRHTDVG